jgi:hypothetical protein
MINHTQINYRQTRNGLFRSGVVIAFLMLAFTSTPAAATEKGDYKAPLLDGFAMTSEEDGDGDGDGVNETHIRHYSNSTGDRVFSMTTKGKLWAWSRESHGGAETKNNYVIRDSDCDGVFDERYSLDEKFHLPDCVK